MRASLVVSSAVVLATSCAAPRALVFQSALPFIDDDYAEALAQSRSRDLPLFVEAWAPWCHSCRSMRAFVLTDPALKRHAGRFAWLAIDTEKPSNAAFLEKFPVSVWPTLMVIDPHQEKAVFRWLGSATASQLVELFDGAERAYRSGSANGPDAQLARADQLYAQGRAAEAVLALRELLASASRQWPARSRAAELLVFALDSIGQEDGCANAAASELKRMPRSAFSAAVAAQGLACAVAGSPDLEGRAQLLQALEDLVESCLAPPPIAMSADDRSALYESLVNARDGAGDRAGKRRAAEQWASFLEAQAEQAPAPEARAVFDSHRLSAYLALGEPDRAIAMLRASEQDLPNDYNPPARLAVAYRALRRYPEALAASDRALSRVYGPRKLRLLRDRAEIFLASGDRRAAQSTLEEAVRFARTLDPAQRPRHVVRSIEQRLAEVSSVR